MAVPAFSHLSAFTELLVTAGVFYFFWQAMARDNFRWGFVWILIAYETVFNITYMASRLAQHAPSPDYPAWATLLLVVHGTLSLVMFLGLISFVFLAFRDRKVEGENYFRNHSSLTWTFLVLWTASVLSGELIYVLQLTDAMAL